MRKKHFSIIVLLIVALVTIVSCSHEDIGGIPKDKEIPEDKPVDTLTIHDYFPVKENTMYVYEGEGNEFAPYRMYFDYIEENKVQQRILDGGTEVVNVIEINEDSVKRVYTRGEAYYRENLLKKKSTEEEIILSGPIKVGTEWVSYGNVNKITSISSKVDTPLGELDAIEVTIIYPEDETTKISATDKRYYAKGFGLVKSIYKYGDMEVSSTLAKIEETPLYQEVAFYYPDVEADELKFTSKEVAFKTNDITKIVLEKAYKEAVASNGGQEVLTKNTRINSLYLNDDGMLYIDLSKDFLTEMNVGSGIESQILDSIATTFGKYYGVDKVILTIDDKLYSSGHIELRKGEYIKVLE